ncbi:DUF1573 domain-containing protein [Polaribacter sp. KT 15]|uniref:DUF1573 domain-containing protein n=1 Tax=Polaribacter sp. KT 15 TaxID=1896175 RepID=UPI00090B24A5|nr:DUF1573 domain-containing protein [Polaribacter sp. KT 15]SHN05195.1 Protein of unknown function [Polaribacter sp. KT 15]
MKLLTTFILFLFVSFSINSQEFKFETESINYGKVSKGANGERVFVFTNIGDAPLIIKNIQSSCGCTVPKKPEKPIMPGEKGEIKVSYDTKRVGGFSKQITIFSNAKTARKTLKIRGFVDKKEFLEKKKSMLSGS